MLSMSHSGTIALPIKARNSSNLESQVRTTAGVPSQSLAQKSPKKRQSSALKSLKDSLKFKGSASHRKNASETVEVSRPSKVRSELPAKNNSLKAKQRLSAQRVSLFKYEKVRAMSCSVDPGIRRGSESSNSAITMRSGDNTSDISMQSHNTVRIKPTTLISSGSLEVYQISTPNLDPKEKTQEMNYLSLGRKDNIVHPILPRLQVSKLGNSGQKFLISFYNPERYWEIEFLPLKDSKGMTSTIKEFESVMSKICKYSRITDQSKDMFSDDNKNLQSRSPTFRKSSVDNFDKGDELCDEEDDLSYLLLDGNDANSGASNAFQESDACINEAFKRAIQHVKPSLAQRKHNGERYPDLLRSSRRFSSYETTSLTPFKEALNVSKRFSSVPTEISDELLGRSGA